MILRPLAAALTALCLSGCTLMLSDYTRPDLPEVASFKGAEDYLGPQIAQRFWEGFSDPRLNQAVELALSHNLSLKSAAVTLEKAQLQSEIAGTQRHPTASASLGSDARRAIDYHDKTHKSSSGSFKISYEADVFGKVSAAVRSADENYRASAYDYYAMRLTVISQTAQAYWQYAYARQILALKKQDQKDSERRLKLITDRYQAGAADLVEADTARINNLKIESEVISAQNQFEKARTALNTLLGQTADHEVETADLEKAKLPQFGLEVPLKLLSRRPDLMESEAKLRKALADYDSARLAFFPDVTLSAGISSGATTTFASFFVNPVAALGAAVTLPFLNFHELSLEQESALRDEDLAKLDFVSTYINAVQEVFDGISDITLAKQGLDNAERQLRLARENYSRYFDRYSAGLEQLSDLLDASDSLRSAESAVLQYRRDLLDAQMALMAAAGGDTAQAAAQEHPELTE
jgi:NodT family efflux transporter outer membrane factor (OMF) lipoprotein